MKKYKQGTVINGVVSGITDYGIFVKIDDFYNGLIHISEISSKYVNNPKDYANIDDSIRAKVIEVDENSNHIKLSLKELNEHNYKQKRRINETSHGFQTLAYMLPHWIDEAIHSDKFTK